MRRTLGQSSFLVSVAFFGATAVSAIAQPVPWDFFVDALSDSTCDLVNAANAELVVLTETGQLVIVTGDDVILVDTFVDLDGQVFFEGTQAGVIDYASDGDGFRTLWWTSLTGAAIEIDEFSGVPLASSSFPSDFGDVACDACPFWDDPFVCAEPIDPSFVLPFPFNICGMNSQFGLGLTAAGLAFMGLARRRRM